MHIEALIKMANQIGGFFEAMPDHPEAVAGVADHIKKFWEPRMRSALLAHVDGGGREDLSAMVLEALDTYRAKLTPLAA